MYLARTAAPDIRTGTEVAGFNPSFTIPGEGRSVSQQDRDVMSEVVPLRRFAAPMAVAALAIAASLVAPDASAQDGVRKVAPRPIAAPSPSAPATPPETSRSRGAERGELSVLVDRAKLIRLPERTQTVVIGNPAIADIAVQKNGIVVVTGKSYGVTNLIALDGAGAMLAESTVSVGAPTDAIVVVQRGLERQSYSCTPSCQPSVLLGDANTYFNEQRGQAEQRNLHANAR